MSRILDFAFDDIDTIDVVNAADGTAYVLVDDTTSRGAQYVKDNAQWSFPVSGGVVTTNDITFNGIAAGVHSMHTMVESVHGGLSNVVDRQFIFANGLDVTGTLVVQETGSDVFSATGVASVTGTLVTQETGSDAFSATGTVAPAGNPELLVDPGIDDDTKWDEPGGVTIASSQAQWRTAAAFSTFWTGSAAANLATVNENTDYTWSATIENYTGGGNFQCQVTFYNSSFGAISTPSNNVNINSTGDFTTTLTAPAGAAYAAFRAKPFSANYDMDWSDVSMKEV